MGYNRSRNINGAVSPPAGSSPAAEKSFYGFAAPLQPTWQSAAAAGYLQAEERISAIPFANINR